MGTGALSGRRSDEMLETGVGYRRSCTVFRAEIRIDVVVGPVRHEDFMTWEYRESGDEVSTYITVRVDLVYYLGVD